jgi:hypothetical protein
MSALQFAWFLFLRVAESLQSILMTQNNHWLHICGSIVAAISEVAEDEQLVGRLDYAGNSNWSHWTEGTSVHTAAVKSYSRGVLIVMAEKI